MQSSQCPQRIFIGQHPQGEVTHQLSEDTGTESHHSSILLATNCCHVLSFKASHPHLTCLAAQHTIHMHTQQTQTFTMKAAFSKANRFQATLFRPGSF